MRKTLLQWGGGGLLFVVLCFSYAAYWSLQTIREDLAFVPALKSPTLFELEPGTPVAVISRQLSDHQWLKHQWALRLALWSGELSGGFQAGTYEFVPGETVSQLLKKMLEGKVKTYSVTLPEGLTLAAIVRVLAGSEGVVKKSPAEYSTISPEDEGWFYPSTYFYHHKTPLSQLIARGREQMEQRLSRAWQDRAPDLPYQKPYDALIMASIIERETARPEERPEIAGVFIRRLLKGMKLQTDPTVIYGLGPAFDGNLRRADLEHDTPYNTYTRSGLPPTPICSPGAAALHAALHPSSGDALYFVARGDGTHVFSSTLTAHNAAVKSLIRQTSHSR